MSSGYHLVTPSPEDTSWRFNVPTDRLTRRPRPGVIHGKVISLKPDAMTLRVEQFPSNRILHADDPSKFILLSLDPRFRFEDQPISVAVEYILRLFKEGLFLNGIQYRFYHHSNSQLRGRSCFLREANSDQELDDRIYAMGDFGRIMNVAKRAKRIGLLFSSAQIDYILNPSLVEDIGDIKIDDEVFSDGCGLISKRLAIALSRAKRIIFRGTRYTPTVFQIRYLGYKGVLMLHPDLDRDKQHLAQFRKSMKKFTVLSGDNTFSVVNHSKPYSFGRLNNDIIVLLSSLGVTNESLLAKQQEYFSWIREASEDVVKAVDFLCCFEMYDLAEKAYLNGIEDPAVSKEIRRLQNSEIARRKDERTDKFKSRTMIHKSRRLFGVCDPYQVLKEGEVHIRITAGRKGATTPIHGDVFIIRNPCLHPGDILKLRAVYNPQLDHLIDCLVFASVAHPGHKAAPSMSSGGDLDGDEFFVCWDSDIMPTKISQSYDYPPNREFNKRELTRQDLARHFASYSSSGVARVSALFAKWARSSPQGALCSQCQELNALHSQSVDGAPIKIPEKLSNPPESTEPYILDLLEYAANTFADEFALSLRTRTEIPLMEDAEDAEILLRQLLTSKQNAITEYELFDLAFRFSQKRKVDIQKFLPHINFSALSFAQKHAMSASLALTYVDYPEIWNSFIRSDILTPRDLYQRSLGQRFSIQRLYSSNAQGLGPFFEYLRMATQDYTRKVMILQTDSRFSIGVFIRGTIPWDAETDPDVEDNVVVCSFMPQSSATVATLRPCTKGYKLHCSDFRFQLYNKQMVDTFIFMNRPPIGARRNESGGVWTSIALQKISETVRTQMGRINKTPVLAIELHVVSNRDRVAHQLFDMWFDHKPTEEVARRFERTLVPYRMNDIKDVDWEDEKYKWMAGAFFPRIPGIELPPHKRKHTPESMGQFLTGKLFPEVDRLMAFAVDYHAEEELFLIFDHMLQQDPFSTPFIKKWIEKYPPLVFTLLKAFPPDEDGELVDHCQPLEYGIIRNVIRTANDTKIASLVALEKLAKPIGRLSIEHYIDLMMLAAHSVRAKQLVQEVLLVLNDARMEWGPQTRAETYGRKHALGVAFDRAEEAGDECPCDEDGKPRRKMRSGPPQQAKLFFGKVKEGEEDDGEDKSQVIKAETRIDGKSTVKLHSHIRLQAASKPENRWVDAMVLDGLVIQSGKGELKIRLMHPAPPEMEKMDWNLYDAGTIATANAMIDALQRLLKEKEECCTFYPLIVGEGDLTGLESLAAPSDEHFTVADTLNASQLTAAMSWRSPLSLIWGPPGTGKTTVIVQILRDILQSYPDAPKILMTASTHNAVDNVLERFISINANLGLLRDDQILRVATDVSKVNQALQDYTINARVGGDITENNRLMKQALARVENAVMVFTTCAGAGLGVLRKFDYDIALIDEASQITEPCALIPLVKGIKRAVIVGDHVQLRPTVRNMGKVIEYDVSLLERLYGKVESPFISQTMLDVQYRSPRELNAFPSNEFYEGRLQTSDDNAEVANFLSSALFPWPTSEANVVIPAVFIHCGAEEDMGGQSKSNEGQVELVKAILPLLTAPKPDVEESQLQTLQITVLSPYTKQLQMLRRALPSSITCSTIDSFQGRESDIIIFSTVRSNVDCDIGFLDDPRRLNVMWTRARLGLIIIGDRKTLMDDRNPLWQRAIRACTEVMLA